MFAAMPHITWLGFSVIIFALQCLRAELVIMSYNAVIKGKLISRYTSVLYGCKSGVTCAKICMSDANCLSFAFNSIRKECYLYDSYLLESENAIVDPGTQLFNGCFSIPLELENYVGMIYIMHAVPSITSQEMCIEECNKDINCTAGAHRSFQSDCIFYRYPVVEAKIATREECRDSCIINSKCITMAYSGTACHLYSVPKKNLNVTPGFAGDTIAEKSSCYPI